jgi:acetyl esterase/lipase
MPVTVEDRTFEGPHGPVPVRLYRPEGDGPHPGFVWSHGGGWVGGDLDMVEAHDTSMAIAEQLPGIVVSVEYRLAPAHRYPVPVNDVAAALANVVADAPNLGIDRDRLGFGGASAGAHLSALAIELVDFQPKALVLVYPATDPVDGPYEDRPDDCLPEHWLDRRTTASLFGELMGPDNPTTDNTVPARGDLASLPPTLVTIAGIDGLRAQAIEYVELLRTAGVDVELHDEPWAYHGYLSNVGRSKRSNAALARHVDWLRDRLAR